MSTIQQTPVVDLECGCGGDGVNGGGAASNDSESSDFFSDAEEGSCFYSTADGDGDGDGDGFNDEEEIMEEMNGSRRVSSVAESESSVCIVQNNKEYTEAEIKLHLQKQEKDCRICHLSLISKGSDSGIPIELGCSCKGDLALAHRHCAETWFKIKGNKICEICNAIACNVVVCEIVIDSGQQTNDSSRTTAATSEQSETPSSDHSRRFFDGRFVNFMLACLVFVFVLSWLFRFNVRS